MDDTAAPPSQAPAPPPVHAHAHAHDLEDLKPVYGVPVTLSVEVGRSDTTIGEVAKLTPGGIIELDRQADQPLDVLVNGRVIARGEVVVIDNQLAVRITEILSEDEIS